MAIYSPAMDNDLLENLLDGSFPTPEEKKAARQNYLKRKSAERRRKIRAKREADEAAALVADFADDSDVELPPIHYPMHASDSKSGRSSSDESDCITVQSPPPHVPADTLQLWMSSDEEAVQQIDGVLKGFFSSVKEAESISKKIGTRSAESDVERLGRMGDKAAAQRGKEPKKSDTKKKNNSHRGLLPAFSTRQHTVSSPSQQHSTATPMVPLETMYPANPPSRTLTSVTSGM